MKVVSRSLFYIIFYKKTYFVMLHKLPNFITRLCLVPELFSKMCFVFHAWEFDGGMISEYLKS